MKSVKQPLYSEFAEHAPDLVDKNDKENLKQKLNNPETELIIFGYEQCPYSAKARNALEKHISIKGTSSRFKNKSVFIGGDWDQIGKWRKNVNHSGSFPVIFMRNKNTKKMEYIGGGNDFEAFVEKDLRIR